MKLFLTILLITLLSVCNYGQKTEVEFGLSVMESSYTAREYGEYRSMRPIISKGGGLKMGSNVLLSTKDSSTSVLLVGVEGCYSRNSTLVKESEFRDNGYAYYSSTEGVVESKQFAFAGKIGVEFRNKKNTIYSQITLLSQYYFKSKNEGRLSTRWTLNDYFMDTITMGGSSENVYGRFDYFGSLMNLEVKFGARLPLENKPRLGMFVFARLRNMKWNTFVKRERFGAGISFML